MPFCELHVKWPVVVRGHVVRVDVQAERDFETSHDVIVASALKDDALRTCREYAKKLACTRSVPSCKGCTKRVGGGATGSGSGSGDTVCSPFSFCSEVCWDAVWNCPGLDIATLTKGWMHPMATCNSEDSVVPDTSVVGFDPTTGAVSDPVSTRTGTLVLEPLCTPWRCGRQKMTVKSTTCVNPEGVRQAPAEHAACLPPSPEQLAQYVHAACRPHITYPIVQRKFLKPRYFDATASLIDVDLQYSLNLVSALARELGKPGPPPQCALSLTRFACQLAVPVCDDCSERRCHQIMPCASVCQRVERDCGMNIQELTAKWRSVAPIVDCADRDRGFCEGDDCPRTSVGRSGCLAIGGKQIKLRDGRMEVAKQLDSLSADDSAGLKGWVWGVIWATVGLCVLGLIACVAWWKLYKSRRSYERNFGNALGKRQQHAMQAHINSAGYNQAEHQTAYRKMSEFDQQDLADNPVRAQIHEARQKQGFTTQNAFFNNNTYY